MNVIDLPIDPLNRRPMVAGRVGMTSTVGVINGQERAVVVLTLRSLEGIDVNPIAIIVDEDAPGVIGAAFTDHAYRAVQQLGR